jgi:hypothetical protein
MPPKGRDPHDQPAGKLDPGGGNRAFVDRSLRLIRTVSDENLPRLITLPARLGQIARRLTVAFPVPRQTLWPNRDEPTRLSKHDLGDGRGNGLAEQAVAAPIFMLRICPRRKFIRRRRVPDINRAPAHDKSEHHLGPTLP